MPLVKSSYATPSASRTVSPLPEALTVDGASVGIITALTPHIGYEHAADIAKEAIRTGASVKDLILQKGILTQENIDKILRIPEKG